MQPAVDVATVCARVRLELALVGVITLRLERLESVWVRDRVIVEVSRIRVKNSAAVNIDKKVKFSHTRYRALGPELIPVYRQSARR